MSNMNNWWKGDPFGDFAGQFNFDFSKFYQDMARHTLSSSDQQLFNQIKKEAVEYFESIGIHIGSIAYRIRISKEQKERVVEFMKNRLAWYNENGFLLTEK